MSNPSGLTSEQLQRIELNRKRAQERLELKRNRPTHQQGAPVTYDGGGSVLRPPPAKQPASLGHHISPLPSGRGGASTSHQFSHQQPSRPSVSSSSTAATPASVRQPPPAQPLPTCSKSSTHPHSTGPYSATSTTSKKPPLIFTKHKSYNTPSSSTPAASSTLSTGPSVKVPAPAKPLGKYISLKEKIKAVFALVSRERFEARVPFDAGVIDIFKKMKTKQYDARNCVWSFGIEDYHHLVEMVRRDCKHVEMDLVPRPVIDLFQGLRTNSGKKKAAPSCSVDWTRISEKLVSTLMQFQKEGVEYSVQREGRVLIADDMGLGKTLQAIAVMNYYRSDWPFLIICPSSVKLTWAEALKRWVPSLRERDINVVLAVKNSTLDCLVNIISYDLAVRMAADLKRKNFQAIVVDESHFLKNYKTARYKAVAPLVKSAKRSLLLSGTPALSRPIELFTQINMLDKNFRSVRLTQFGVRYCNGKKDHFGWNFSGASNMQELQLYMEEAVMIRRMKNDVLEQLPEKRRQMILLDLSSTKVKSKDLKDLRQELNEAGKLKAMDRKNALLPLYEKTGRMKIYAINDYILDLLEGGRKLIVFGHHRVVLDSVCDSLNAKSYGHIRIDGRTAAEVRQTYCDQFQHDEKCLVAVLSITAANAGLTLTASSTVVFTELFWNPGILIQAEDRAYRIGQHNSVNIHYLVAKDTADDYIWLLIQTKLGVLHQAGLAKEDFSKADSTSVVSVATQKTLFDCFGDFISEDRSSTRSVSPPESAKCESSEAAVAKHSVGDISSNASMSNWFDELDEDDFNVLDMNV